VPLKVLDISRASKELGWNPDIRMEDSPGASADRWRATHQMPRLPV
jgi:nucleoside-diphosphate-sugar epimerase